MPAVTTMHFQMVADVLRSVKPLEKKPMSSSTAQWLRTVDAFSKTFFAANPRFNKALFEKACEKAGDYR